jgi:DNA-binding transcriptional MocR family regulator
MVGFIFLHRDLLEWEWYQNPEVSRLFIHLLLKVNFIDKKWHGNEVKRGQLITSSNHLASELNLSIQKIRTALKKLESSGYIIRQTTNKFTLITIVNYNNRQSPTVLPNNQKTTRTTNNQLSNNNPTTTTKESNKENKFNKEKIELRKENFKKQVFEHSHYSNKILIDFFNYWSEFNTAKTKMKFENQRGFFEIEIRLKKWSENEWKTATKNAQQKNTISNR